MRQDFDQPEAATGDARAPAPGIEASGDRAAGDFGRACGVCGVPVRWGGRQKVDACGVRRRIYPATCGADCRAVRRRARAVEDARRLLAVDVRPWTARVEAAREYLEAWMLDERGTRGVDVRAAFAILRSAALVAEKCHAARGRLRRGRFVSAFDPPSAVAC